MDRLPAKFNNSRFDDAEDAKNAKKHDMTVADWKRTNGDRVADRIGQADLEAARKSPAARADFFKKYGKGR